MTDKVLAKPSDICCLKGTIHEGEAQGKTEQIEGVDTYVATPPGTQKGVVMFFPDVFGFFKNNFLIMDAIAQSGYLVLGPDYFRGDPVWKHSPTPLTDPNFDFQAWMAKHMEFCNPFVPKWVATVKEKYGDAGKTKFFCVGYCWGAPYVCDQLSDKGICTAGAFAHPAFLKESHFKNLSKPLFLSLAQTDMTFNTESRNESISLMQDEGKTFHVQLFSGVEHGFALRGNMAVPYEKWCKEQSLQGIVEWYDLWLTA